MAEEGKGHPYTRNEHDKAVLVSLLKRGSTLPAISKAMKLSLNCIETHYKDVLRRYPRPCGHPRFEPTDEQRKVVILAASVGTSQEETARFIGCSPETLRRHFRDELNRGATGANLKVGGNLFNAATGPTDRMSTVTAMIWWTKARMGWKDTSRIENTGADGKPIQTQNLVTVWLPDNGRGDTIAPKATIDGVLLEAPKMTAIEADSLDEDADSESDSQEESPPSSDFPG
jgi:hypothetical protein